MQSINTRQIIDSVRYDARTGETISNNDAGTPASTVLAPAPATVDPEVSAAVQLPLLVDLAFTPAEADTLAGVLIAAENDAEFSLTSEESRLIRLFVAFVQYDAALRERR